MIEENELMAKKSWHISETISDLIRHGFESRPKHKRNYLGASSVGDPCSRRITYALNGTNADVSTTCATYCTLEIGHVLEDLVASWLIQAGFILKTHNENHEQFGFSQAGGRFQGHVDGIIQNGPLKVQYPMLWENKTAKASSWRELKKNRLEIVNQIYYAQVQLYMAYLNLDNCLFTSLNKDTSEIYAEIVPFNAQAASHYSDRAVCILLNQESGTLEPRIASCPEYFECKMCRYRQICWEKKLGSSNEKSI